MSNITVAVAERRLRHFSAAVEKAYEFQFVRGDGPTGDLSPRWICGRRSCRRRDVVADAWND